METILYYFLIFAFIAGFNFIINIIANFFRKTNDLTFKIEKKYMEESKSEVLLVNGKGIISDPLKKILIAVTITDITSGTDEPVLCFIPEFRYKDMYLFTREMSLPYETTEFQEYVPLGIIVPDSCIFPESKKRKLKVHIAFLNPEGEKIKDYSIETSYYNNKRGYKEIVKYKNRLSKLELKILSFIAISDNHLDARELNFIQNKKEKILQNADEDKKYNLRKELDDIIENAVKNKNATAQNFYNYLDQFNEISTQAEKYDLIKSCTDIMSIDGNIANEELKVINNISKFLKLDYKKVNSLKDIHILSGSKISSNNEALLGIKSEWSYEETQNYLKQQFIKWNSRMQNCHSEKEMQNAQKMIDLITETIKKYEKVPKAQ